jgi:YVTN family beta-propeller protein
MMFALAGLTATMASAQVGDFVQFESPQLNPVAITPAGNTLLVCNTADNRLEVFDISSPGGAPVRVRSISVGFEPVSVRLRSATEAWVVNHLSDSISIVDLPTGRVVRTLQTGDEPCDVVFAGTPQRAFISCSQLNQLRVVDPANPASAPTIVPIDGADPRALAVSPDGTRVYAAIFESGNKSTLVRRQEVSLPTSPYAGVNPPPNSGNTFSPAIRPGNPPAAQVSQIVRKSAAGQWLDGNGRNWSSLVTWDLHDHDVAIIDTSSLAVSYASGLLTSVMTLAVAPNGNVTALGTEAKNEVRFEPNVQSTFLRVQAATFSPASPATVTSADLNPHLTYTAKSIPQSSRDQSIGDPRGAVWNSDGTRLYVSGMGSNNVIITNAAGARLGRIEVGQGPTGLALNPAGTRLYVLNRFDGSISVIDTLSSAESARVSFFDPTTATVKAGRPLLYDTHAGSGLGQIACASCHIDGRNDAVAWDLGDPSGTVKAFDVGCRTPNCRPWHPMKGPMVTQTLQGIVGNGPMHWRGDRENLAAFAGAFVSLQGADAQPSPAQMRAMTDFISTVKYPPNPNRNVDGSLPASLPSSAGGTGDPRRGQNIFNTAPTLGPGACVVCHAGPTGTSTLVDDPLGQPQPLKIAQLRGMHEKTGFSRTAGAVNSRGFGYNHDGEADNLFTLLNQGFAFAPGAQGVQQRKDVEAFMLAFSMETHPAIGQQITFDGTNNTDTASITRLNTFTALADTNQVGLIAKGRVGVLDRGWAYIPGAGRFQADRLGETILTNALRLTAAAGGEITFTVVPFGMQTRLGIDRDRDGYLDRDELDAGSDPANALSIPACIADYNRDFITNLDDLGDFITDFYVQPPIPGGIQTAAPTYPDRAAGYGTPCPDAPDAPAPYSPDAYRAYGYRAGFSPDGTNACPAGNSGFPNLDNLGDFITAYYAGC